MSHMMLEYDNNPFFKLAWIYQKLIVSRFGHIRGITRPYLELQKLGIWMGGSYDHKNNYEFRLEGKEKRKIKDIDDFKRNLRDEYKLCTKLIDEVDNETVFYDVGAFHGFHTIVGSLGGLTYSFEPHKETLEKLKENVRLNKSQEIKLVNSVLWDKEEKVNFSEGGGGGSKIKDKGITLEAITLDKFVFDENNSPPDLIKIDVEGAELRVLKGGEKTLEKYSPKILVEVHDETNNDKMNDFGDSRSELLNFLNSKGYSIEEKIGSHLDHLLLSK